MNEEGRGVSRALPFYIEKYLADWDFVLNFVSVSLRNVIIEIDI